MLPPTWVGSETKDARRISKRPMEELLLWLFMSGIPEPAATEQPACLAAHTHERAFSSSGRLGNFPDQSDLSNRLPEASGGFLTSGGSGLPSGRAQPRVRPRRRLAGRRCLLREIRTAAASGLRCLAATMDRG